MANDCVAQIDDFASQPWHQPNAIQLVSCWPNIDSKPPATKGVGSRGWADSTQTSAELQNGLELRHLAGERVDGNVGGFADQTKRRNGNAFEGLDHTKDSKRALEKKSKFCTKEARLVSVTWEGVRDS